MDKKPFKWDELTISHAVAAASHMELLQYLCSIAVEDPNRIVSDKYFAATIKEVYDDIFRPRPGIDSCDESSVECAHD